MEVEPTVAEPSQEELLTRVARGELASVRRELDSPKLTDDDRLRLRAELALHGHGLALDLVIATRRAREKAWPQLHRYAAAAARALAAAHAESLASTLLQDLPDVPEVALARQQLDAGVWVGTSPRAFAAHRCAASGDRDGFATGLRALASAEDESALERVDALSTLAGLALAQHDFPGCAASLAAALELAPNADGTTALHYRLGLARLAADEHDAGLASLHTAAASADGPRPSPEAGRARDLARQLETQPREPADWHRCRYTIPQATQGMRGVVAACQKVFAVAAPGEIPGGFSMGPACAALRRMGLAMLRLHADPNAVQACLDEGALLVIEEERPTEQGFRFVLAFEPKTGLLLLRDPDAHTAALLSFAEQEQRSALVDMSALAILGHGPDAESRVARLTERGVKAEPVYAWLDACEANEDGERPPAAEIRRLTQRILAERPDHPLGHKFLGEELSRDHDRRDELLRWYADASERYPKAEWVWQIYARFLESERRYAESAIAWAEASRLDPRDARNTFGRAYALIQIGRKQEAEKFLHKTLMLAPSHSLAYSWLASTARERRDFDLALAATELWQATDRDNPVGPLLALANLAEERGEHTQARASLEQARQHQPKNPHIARRLSWHMTQQGTWAEARSMLAPFVGAKPAMELRDHDVAAELAAWAAHLAWASGQPEEGMALVQDGIERLGPSATLIRTAVRIALTALCTPEREREVLVALCQRRGNQADGWGNLLTELCRGGHVTEAEWVLDELKVKFNKDAENCAWLEGRSRMQLGQADRARPLLEEVFAKSEDWDPCRAYLAIAYLASDASRALELVKPRTDGYLAVQWMTAVAALESMGEPERAAGLRERLGGLSAELIADGGRVLRICHRPDLARDLCAIGLSAHTDSPLLLTEQLRDQLALDAIPAALTTARQLLARDTSLPTLTLAAALRAQAWEDLDAIARLALRELRDFNDEDGLALRAVVAMLRARAGQPQERLDLLALAPDHPAAMAMLARLGRALGLSTADEDEARLAKIAPGMACRPRTEVLL